MFQKLILKLKSKKGMTLLEVLVASTIAFIVLTGVVSLVVPMTRAIHTNQQLSDAQHMSELVIQKLTKELRYTKNISIDSVTVPVTDPPTNPAMSISSSQACFYSETDLANDVLQFKFKSKTDAALTDAIDVVGTGNYNKALDYKFYFLKAPSSVNSAENGKNSLKVYIQACKKNSNIVVYQTIATIPLLNNASITHVDSSLDTVTDVTGFNTDKRYFIYY